jgi:hypothetical protein
METETEILIKLIIEGDQNKIDRYCDYDDDWIKNIDCKIVAKRIKDVENSIAYNFMAYIYCEGINVNIDKNKSFYYSKMSAECDDYIGQYSIGNRYVERKKYEKALHNFQLSAKKGFARAQNSIGYMYGNGYGV